MSIKEAKWTFLLPFFPFLVHCSFCIRNFHRLWISNASMFSNSPMSVTKISPVQIPSAINAYSRNIPGKTFLPNWWGLDRSREEIGQCPTIAQKESRSLQMDLRIAFRTEFSRLPGGLEQFADSNSIPQNQPSLTLRTALS